MEGARRKGQLSSIGVLGWRGAQVCAPACWRWGLVLGEVALVAGDELEDGGFAIGSGAQATGFTAGMISSGSVIFSA